MRDGRLLPNDKDLDVVVPVQQFQTAVDAMSSLGWKPAWIAVKAVNFRSFVHTQHAITLDLFGYEMDAANQCVWGGCWPVGLPREQGRLLEAWVQGQASLVARRLRTLARLDGADPLVHAFAAPHTPTPPC